jgi:hypothetical protein
MAKYIFHGKVGQVIDADSIKSVSTRIVMGENGEMFMESDIIKDDE